MRQAFTLDHEQPWADRAPLWLPEGHTQTIWAAKVAQSRPLISLAPTWQRQRWSTPDGDFVDVDSQWRQPDRPQVILFHGLEGSSASHYARAWAYVCSELDLTLRVIHFRGCSGEPNLAPRAYHSGDAEEMRWMLTRARDEAEQVPLFAVGYSLGGNVLVKWLGEKHGGQDSVGLAAAAAISAPLDLRAAGEAIEQGLNRWLYTPMFLSTMRKKAALKWRQYPNLFDLEATQRATTLREFDDCFTAPLHGYADVDDYWARASARPGLANVETPLWIINAKNDPFVPWESVNIAVRPAPAVRFWHPENGGHAGFSQHPPGSRVGNLWSFPLLIANWFLSQNAAYG